jgi:hypothetical protein
MAKALADILKGTNASKKQKLTLGKEPGVDYAPKSEGDRDFVSDHEVEKFADRAGNSDDVYNASKIKRSELDRHGHVPKPKDVKAYSEKNEESKDSREYGYEGEMAMSQIKSIMNHSEQLMKMLKPDTDLPEWVQSKITLSNDYIQTAADYFATEMSEASKCNMSESGTMCEVHGMKSCGSSNEPRYQGKVLNEKKPKTVHEEAIASAVKQVQVMKESEFGTDPLDKLRLVSNKAMAIVMSANEEDITETWVKRKIFEAEKALGEVNSYMEFKKDKKDKKLKEGSPVPNTYPDQTGRGSGSKV